MPNLPADLVREITLLKRRLTKLETQRTAWQDWTPTVTQSGTVTTTINYARYRVMDNNLAILTAHLAVTGTGASGNAIVISGFPTAIAPARVQNVADTVGSMSINDASVQPYFGWAYFASSTTIQARQHNVGANLGANPSFTLISGDSIGLHLFYEI